jgi:uncharacterized protein YciI
LIASLLTVVVSSQSLLPRQGHHWCKLKKKMAVSTNCLYLIRCVDDDSNGFEGSPFPGLLGGTPSRLANYSDHKEWQHLTNDPSSPRYIRKISAGPIISDDGKHMIGSLFIVQSSKTEADEFIHRDPLYVQHVWKDVSATRFVAPNSVKPVRMEGQDAIVDW